MSAPDISRLTALPEGQWRALGERLQAIGVNEENLKPLRQVGTDLFPHARVPLLRSFLRRQESPLARALRIFLVSDPVTHDEAVSALGDDLLAVMTDSGLVCEISDGMAASPFRLALAEGVYVFGDELRHKADAAMTCGQSTQGLLDAIHPNAPISRALDLGCGAGTLALVLARHAESVVAIDINPRALSFARINSMINGIGNVEFRQGDLFTPVAGEEFDVIVSQPPWVAQPDGFAPATYLYGGTRGDELPLRILAGVSRHLRSGGRAVILTEWPELDDEPLGERVRAAVGSADIDALLVMYPPVDLDTWTAFYAAGDHLHLDEAYERDAILQREHFVKLNIRRFRHCYNVLQKNQCGRPWTAVWEVPATVVPSVAIDLCLARHNLLRQGREALLSARLRVPEGAITTTEWPLGGGAEPTTSVRFPRPSLLRPVELTPEWLRLVELVHASPAVRDGIAAFMREFGYTEAALDKISEELVHAVELGVLQPPS